MALLQITHTENSFGVVLGNGKPGGDGEASKGFDVTLAHSHYRLQLCIPRTECGSQKCVCALENTYFSLVYTDCPGFLLFPSSKQASLLWLAHVVSVSSLLIIQSLPLTHMVVA